MTRSQARGFSIFSERFPRFVPRFSSTNARAEAAVSPRNPPPIKPSVTRDVGSKSCIICLDSDVEFSSEPLPSGCSHPPEACVSCIAQTIKVQVVDRMNPSNIRCPSEDCSQLFGYDDVRRGLGEDTQTFDRYVYIIAFPSR